MEKNRSKILCLALAAVLALGAVAFAAFAEDPQGGIVLTNPPSPYEYRLYVDTMEPVYNPSDYEPSGTDPDVLVPGASAKPVSWNIKMDLYLFQEQGEEQKVDGGFCGIKYPARLTPAIVSEQTTDTSGASPVSQITQTAASSVFEPSKYIDITDGNDPPQPTDSSYTALGHFFRWTLSVDLPEEEMGANHWYPLEYRNQPDVISPNPNTFEDIMDDTGTPQTFYIDDVPAGVRLKLGTYSFNIGDRYPAKGSITTLDWLQESGITNKDLSGNYLPNRKNLEDADSLQADDFIPSEEVWNPDYADVFQNHDSNGLPVGDPVTRIGAYQGFCVVHTDLGADPPSAGPDGYPQPDVPLPEPGTAGEDEPSGPIKTEQVDIPFVMVEPTRPYDYWLDVDSSLLIAAYDKKKPVYVSVYKEDDNDTVADRQILEEDLDLDGTPEPIMVAQGVYKLVPDAELGNTAICGYFEEEINLAEIEPLKYKRVRVKADPGASPPIAEVAETGTYEVESGSTIDSYGQECYTTYTFVISKASHLSCTFRHVRYAAGVTKFGDVTLTTDKIYLPCGDVAGEIDSAGKLKGDGQIILSDRAKMQRYSHGSVAWIKENCLPKLILSDKSDPNSALILDPGWKPTEEYYLDLNGDGTISIADLAIMMSNRNYNRRESDADLNIVWKAGI